MAAPKLSVVVSRGSPDEELFTRFRDRRDLPALAELYDRFEAPLLSFAARMLGPPAATADDVLQETWMRALRAEWTPDAPLRAWLFRIARNLCLDQLRARGVALDAEGRLDPLEVAGAFSYPLSDPLFVEIMERAVLTLPPAQREVVLLRIEGLTFMEISRITLVATNTLKSRMNLARKALQAYLKERGYDGQ
jgi:RNA polymerase sigma-70 factor (ECF subfamily)